MTSGHPNTAAALIFGGLGTLAVYLLNKYAGTHLTPAAGAGIATGLASLRLYIGRRGIRRTLSDIWNGSDPAAPTTLASERPPKAGG